MNVTLKISSVTFDQMHLKAYWHYAADDRQMETNHKKRDWYPQGAALLHHQAVQVKKSWIISEGLTVKTQIFFITDDLFVMRYCSQYNYFYSTLNSWYSTEIFNLVLTLQLNWSPNFWVTLAS